MLIQKCVKVTKRLLTRARFGKPRRSISIEAYKANEPDLVHLVHASRQQARIPPRNMGSIGKPLAEMAITIPSLYVVELVNGRAIGEHELCFSRANDFIRETSWHDEALSESDLPLRYPSLKRVHGTCLSLLSEYSSDNYGHHLMDALSRVGLARDAGFTSEHIDHYYLHPPSSPSAKQMMQALGIELDKCIWANEVSGIVADRLIATSFPGTKRNYSAMVPQTLRRPFETSQPPCTFRKIYIPRRGTRKLSNGAEIEAIAQRSGFEIYDFRKIANEFEYLREASIIVGPHGSDLSNIAVCQAGTKVLELIPSDHVHPYFYTIAEGAGLDYSFIVGESEFERPAGTVGPSPYDFSIDPGEFSNAIEQITSEAEAQI